MSCIICILHVVRQKHGNVSCMIYDFISIYWTNMLFASFDLMVELFPWVAVPTGNYGVSSHPTLFRGVTGSHASGAAARGKGVAP